MIRGDRLPTGIIVGQDTTLVWDNNDFGEKTLSGKGTTHNTIGIIIQHPKTGLTQLTHSGKESPFKKHTGGQLNPNQLILQSAKVEYFTTLSKLKLKTFTDMGKTVKSRVRGTEIALKTDRNLIARLVVIGKVRKIDLHEIMSYCLGPLPAPFATRKGCLVKTKKAAL